MIISNNYCKKARIIFVKLLSISLKVFFLYTIGTTLNILSKLCWNLRGKWAYTTTTDIYANAVSNWWCTVAKPEGLAQVIKYYTTRLPVLLDWLESLDQEMEYYNNLPYRTMLQRGVFLIMPLYNLLDFLKDKYMDILVQINCLFDEYSLPSIEFGLVEWGMRMEFGLSIIKVVMEYGIQRKATYIQLIK